MSAPEASDAREKRSRILQAALEVCSLRGVAAARMDEVAARAGVSKGTLYRFFRSKEDLFLATLLEAYEEGLRIVDLGAASRDPGQRLEALLEGLCRVLEAVGPRMGVHYQAWGVVANEPAFEARLYGFLETYHRARDAEVEELIREGQRSGAFRSDVDVAALTTGVSMLLNGFLYRASFDPGSAQPAALRACFDAMVKTRLLADGGGDG